ncbi:MAG: glycosyltransferase family 2 protein [Alphaproteobacteria bacterium]|nr:glycosyltransferase family 2 protein [Alphaproteobacteria bacterium]
MTPVVSVIIPVHDGARFLPRAVATVREQGMADCEIVVVDDGSTDETGAVARLLAEDAGNRLRIVAADHGGPAAARNRGLEAAAGALIAFLDADDLWPSDRMARLRARLAADPGLDFVHGKLQPVREDPADPLWGQLYPEGAPIVGPSSLCTGLFHRRAFDRVGSLDETLRLGEDMDWYLRAIEQDLRLVIIDRVVLHYRLHGGNLTRDREAVKRSVQQVVTRSLLRRRRAGDRRPLPAPSAFLETCGSKSP